jgi:tight adherence protein C
MSAALAMAAGAAAWLVATGRRLDRRPTLGRYLHPGEQAVTASRSRRRLDRRLAVIGLSGGIIGAIAAMAVPGAPPPLLGLACAAAGLLGARSLESTRRQRRSARLQQELPVVADALALRVLAGSSVAAALTAFIAQAAGVARDELAEVVADHRRGTSLGEALHGAARTTAHPDGARLYELLGHAHESGGRLADALADLAVDFRATLARELTAEGGRRALAAYGPILALMVPVTLLFLMFPTLAGLSALSQTP